MYRTRRNRVSPNWCDRTCSTWAAAASNRRRSGVARPGAAAAWRSRSRRPSPVSPPPCRGCGTPHPCRPWVPAGPRSPAARGCRRVPGRGRRTPADGLPEPCRQATRCAGRGWRQGRSRRPRRPVGRSRAGRRTPRQAGQGRLPCGAGEHPPIVEPGHLVGLQVELRGSQPPLAGMHEHEVTPRRGHPVRAVLDRRDHGLGRVRRQFLAAPEPQSRQATRFGLGDHLQPQAGEVGRRVRDGHLLDDRPSGPGGGPPPPVPGDQGLMGV